MMSLFLGQGHRDWARRSVRPPKASQPWYSTESGREDRPAPARRSKTTRVSPTAPLFSAGAGREESFALLTKKSNQRKTAGHQSPLLGLNNSGRKNVGKR